MTFDSLSYEISSNILRGEAIFAEVPFEAPGDREWHREQATIKFRAAFNAEDILVEQMSLFWD
jgi:hypothetical protein